MSPKAPSITSGSTFIWHNHLWVVVSEPVIDPQRVIVVSMSRVQPGCDMACLLQQGEHSFIREPTYMAYYLARTPSLTTLRELHKKGECIPHEDVSPEVLAQIIQGAIDSDEMPHDLQLQLQLHQ